MSVAPESSKKPNGGITPQFLLDAIRLHPIAFFCLLIASLSVGAAVYTLYPSPKNTAAVIFHLTGNTPRIINSEQSVDLKSFQDSQVNLIKSSTVFQATMKNEKIKSKVRFLHEHPNPNEWLDQNLKIDFKKGPQFMKVYLEGNNPEEMKTILEALKEAYIEKFGDSENDQRKTTLNRIEKTINEYETKKKITPGQYN